MPEMSVADEAELYLKMVADPAGEPGLYECLACFVVATRRGRSAATARCLWTQWFRDLKSPTATGARGPSPQDRRPVRLRPDAERLPDGAAACWSAT